MGEPKRNQGKGEEGRKRSIVNLTKAKGRGVGGGLIKIGDAVKQGGVSIEAYNG